MYMKSNRVIFPRKSVRWNVFSSISFRVKLGAAESAWVVPESAIVTQTRRAPAQTVVTPRRSAPPARLTSVHTRRWVFIGFDLGTIRRERWKAFYSGNLLVCRWVSGG